MAIRVLMKPKEAINLCVNKKTGTCPVFLFVSFKYSLTAAIHSAFHNNRLFHLLNIFNDAGNALTSAHTGCNHSVFFIEPFHIMQVLNREFAAGTTQRVT